MPTKKEDGGDVANPSRDASSTSPPNNNNNSRGDEDDTMSSTSSSPWRWMSSLPERYRRTVDEQRVERLQQCRQLADVLRACREDRADRPQLEDFPMGIRSVRYFQWRRRHDDDDDDDAVPADPACLREEHALWSCRAVALRCGGELVRLRDCFHEHHTVTDLLGADVTGTAYQGTQSSGDDHDDDAKKKKNIPCADLQKAVGDCVARNAAALAERRAQREK